MADNIDITPGTGKTILTDDCTTGHAQIVKLGIATDGSATLIPADGTDGLLVNLGTNNDVVVSASNLDIRDLAQTQDNIKVGDGTSFIDIDTAPTDGETNGGKRLLHTEAWSWVYNGTSWDRARGSATDGTLVNLGTNNDVTVTGTVTANAGTNLNTSTLAIETGGNLATIKTNTDGLAASGGGGYIRQDSTATIAKETGGNLATAVTALQLIDDTVYADDAAFTIATSKLQAVGGIAVAHGSAPDAADAADAGVFLMNRHRVQWVIGGHPNVVTLEAEYTSAQTDTAVVTVGAGSKIVVTQIQAVVSNATTATPSIRVGFGTANTPTTTGVVLTHGGMAGGGGVSRGDGSGVLGVGADNEDLRCTCSVPTGGGIRVLVTYYTIET